MGNRRGFALRASEGPIPFRQGCSQLPARADGELREHLVQMPFNGPRADEESRTDLRIREALTCKPGDLRFLWGQLIASLDASVNRRARRQQFPACALRKAIQVHRVEHFV